MQNSKEDFFNPSFSHIYIEKKAWNHRNTKKIVNYFPKGKIIMIHHYKEVFSRGSQDFHLQKKSSKIILATKENHLIYRGADVCDDFGNKHFYYTSSMMNCVYDCAYCYLQGMYTSGNIVVFVNIEDIFCEIERMLKEHPVYLCISYDTDILAFEKVLGYGKEWIDFASKHPKLTIELRTKSTNIEILKNVKAQENIILAWTLSPIEVIQKFEKKTPPLMQRLQSIKEVLDRGWNVRLCFDPLLAIDNWKDVYRRFINTVFMEVPGDKIYDISMGIFRVSKEYLKRMRKQRPESLLLHYPYEMVNGLYSYHEAISKDMLDYVFHLVHQHVVNDKLYVKG
ncbi:MAG: radical SAM protein [Eubacteriales bacterium]